MYPCKGAWLPYSSSKSGSAVTTTAMLAGFAAVNRGAKIGLMKSGFVSICFLMKKIYLIALAVLLPCLADAQVERLTNQALLAKFAVGHMDSDVRSAAVKKLTDQALLAKIAVEDIDEYVRSAAVSQLTDQALLAKIAVGDKEALVRRAAVPRLTDKALLTKIAAEDKDRDVREAAAYVIERR